MNTMRDQRPVYTIGYGKRSVDEFVTVLTHFGIDTVVDVRSAPYSKHNQGFSKDPLTALLAKRGIAYIYLGDRVGGRPIDPACYIDGRVDYERVRRRTWYQEGIEKVLSLRAEGRNLVLMCGELRPEECHRSKLIGETLVARADRSGRSDDLHDSDRSGRSDDLHDTDRSGRSDDLQGSIDVVHIDETGAALIPHADVMRRLTGDQLALFEPEYTSRKKYES